MEWWHFPYIICLVTATYLPAYLMLVLPWPVEIDPPPRGREDLPIPLYLTPTIAHRSDFLIKKRLTTLDQAQKAKATTIKI